MGKLANFRLAGSTVHLLFASGVAVAVADDVAVDGAVGSDGVATEGDLKPQIEQGTIRNRGADLVYHLSSLHIITYC